MKRAFLALVALSMVLGLAWSIAEWRHRSATGLRVVALSPDGAPSGRGAVTRVIDGSALGDGGPRAGMRSWRWSGHWVVGATGRQRLRLRVDGSARVQVDGRTVVSAASAGRRAGLGRAEIPLGAGVHTVAITWQRPPADPRRLDLVWGEPGRGPRPFEGALLFADRPGTLAIGLERARGWLGALALLGLLGAVLSRLPLARLKGVGERFSTPRRIRLATGLALALIVLYGAALRWEALVGGYWGSAAPGWARAIASRVEAIRPSSFDWPEIEEPYKGSDPGAYIRYGREMRGLYEPRVREPLFVLATKVGIALLGDSNVGVSLASGFFSVLALLLTYLVGAQAFSRLVGLGAALALAIERRAIGQGVAGWRDEAFAVMVLISAYAVLRLLDGGRFRDAVLLGVGGGLACLTRVTAPTLVVPLVLLLVFFPRSRPWRRRLELAATAGLIALAVAGPFMLSCAIRYGDPFYSINQHVVFYRTRADLAYEPGMTVLDYLRRSFRPFQLLDTAFIGYTEYPFGSRWSYEDWAPWLSPLLAHAAVAGLVLFLGSVRGRVLLLVHAAAMFPFVFTHETRLGGPWRLTFHAYPFYLLAAAWALYVPLRLALSRSERQTLMERCTRRRVGLIAAGLVALVVTSWGLWHGLMYMRLAETVTAGGSVTRPPVITAGQRDAFFFTDGWHPLVSDPAWPGRRARYTSGATGSVRLPLVAGRGYRLGLRLDPLFSDPRHLPTVKVSLNGKPLTTLHLTFRPQKSGRYIVDVPAAMVRHGANRLTLTADSTLRAVDALNGPRTLPGDWLVALEVQYVVIRPEGPNGERPAAEVEAEEAAEVDGQRDD